MALPLLSPVVSIPRAAPRPAVSVLLAVRDADDSIVSRISRLVNELRAMASDFQLIVVDDCSGDQTLRLLGKMESRIPELKVVPLVPARGMAGAIAAGARFARGLRWLVLDLATPWSAFFFHRLQQQGEAPVVFALPGVTGDNAGPGSALWGRRAYVQQLIEAARVGSSATLDEHLRLASRAGLPLPVVALGPRFELGNTRGRRARLADLWSAIKVRARCAVVRNFRFLGQAAETSSFKRSGHPSLSGTTGWQPKVERVV